MRFENAFVLAETGEALPAGAYKIETEEELVEGLSRPVFRRVLTLLHLPVPGSRSGLTQTVTVDPDALDAALARDRTKARRAS